MLAELRSSIETGISPDSDPDPQLPSGGDFGIENDALMPHKTIAWQKNNENTETYLFDPWVLYDPFQVLRKSVRFVLYEVSSGN
jgi:hypothetical protein